MGLLKKAASLFIFHFIFHCSYAQENRYMVFFTDKDNSEFSITNPQEYLSSRALNRRAKHGISVDQSDLPVNVDYIQAVEALGASTYFSTKWMNAVLVEMDQSLIPTVLALSFVDEVLNVAPGSQLLNGEIDPIPTDPIISSNPGNFSDDVQNSMVGIPEMHQSGFQGQGVFVAVLDNGFPNLRAIDAFSRLQSNNQLLMTRDFANNQRNVNRGEGHGLRVLSILAAENPLFQGGIPEATYALFITEDPIDEVEYRIEEYNWLFAAEAADSAGVDIISTSVGYSTFDRTENSYNYDDMDGNTTVISRAAGWANSKGILVITSAGNEGNNRWQFITAPADHPDVIAVGAANIARRRASISSIGPNSIGDTKPDVSAFGSGVTTMDRNGALVLKSGTSLAAPFITAIAAGLLEARPEATNAELLLAIKASGHLASSPNNELGYGIPTFAGSLEALDNLRIPIDKEVSVFPNPSSESSTFVKFSDEVFGQQFEFEIISMSGEVAITGNVTPNQVKDFFEIEWRSTAPGIYLLKLRSNSTQISRRLIKY